MGIPAVVSLAGITTRIETGDWVEMDGARGTVRLDIASDLEPHPDSGGRIVEPGHGTDT